MNSFGNSAPSPAVMAAEAGREVVCAAGGSDHVVQFYEHEDFLYDAVARFLAEGLEAGQPLVVIATAEHRDAFYARLASRGYDVDRARRTGQVDFLDAREALSTFMAGPMPDARLFRAGIGGAIGKSLRGRNDATVRAYGEMVDMLWRDGNHAAAIRLEELWNDLASTHSFSLLCAYAMGNFYKEAHADAFQEICRQHGRVLPAESYSELSEDTRAREISLLQQRARALESEIEHRKALEQALRGALADRRRAEEALRRSEQELRDFLENAVEGLHWVGPDGTILWANRAEMDLLGYARGEYIGHSIAEFHADREAIDDILARLAHGETLHEYEARLRCKDGSIRHVLINSNGLWQDGKFVHTRCFTRDITDRKRAEAERERLLAAERAARAEAEEASRAKGEFLAVMSHELRTPLNAIIGYIDLMLMGVPAPLTEGSKRQARRVGASARHLLQLIEQILTFSRIDAGHEEVRIERVDLGETIRETAELVRPLVAQRGLAFGCSAPDDLAPIETDPGKVRQILLNLLSNAIKFTDSGKVDLTVESAGDGVAVSVRDTGIGLEPGELEWIFEPFRQVRQSASGRPSGTGLGLSVTRQLARLLGGDITVESTRGEGSTFTVRLPGHAVSPVGKLS